MATPLICWQHTDSYSRASSRDQQVLPLSGVGIFQHAAAHNSSRSGSCSCSERSHLPEGPSWANLRVLSLFIWGLSILCDAVFSNKDSLVQINALVRGLSLIFLFACATSAMAEAPGDPKSVKQDDKGKNLDAKGDPTFSVKPDGLVYLFGLPSIPFRMPRLPRPRWRRLHLRACS